MKLTDFDFVLPPDLVAQKPAEKRTDSRLMILDRQDKTVRHEAFTSLVNYLAPGDLLVLNDTRVIPARLFGKKESGGKVEVLLVERHDPEAIEWDCLTKSSRPLKIGTKLCFAQGLTGTVIDEAEHPKWRIRFNSDESVATVLDRIGHMPLPPYIDREDTTGDRERYQTVFAKNKGALAAPTAGLHFTDEILAQVRAAGVEIRYITLHVGIGTFLPVRVENIPDHRMHEERFEVDAETARALTDAKREGRRVVAVGTTVARTLESAWDDDLDGIAAGRSSTDIFIYPGYDFRVVDALLTNFHLPGSTLLMLVSAFAGREFVLDAYRQAIAERYRFYSYGDCMLIH